MSQTKQRSSAAKGVAVFFIVFIILELLVIVGVSMVFKNENVTPSLAGYSMYIMKDTSMGDAVPKDALVIAADGAPSRDGIKKAVIAEEVPGVGTSVFWLADVSTGSDINTVQYTIFRDKEPDKVYNVKNDQIVGTASSYYLTAGRVIKFITSEFGRIACIAVPLFLFVLLELIIMLFSRSRYDDDEDYDDDDDDEEEEEPVKLDDFLFGGENDKEKLGEQARAGEEETAPARAADPEQYAPRQPKAAEEPAAEVSEPEAAEEPEKPAVDPAYYEKAAKLIDGEPDNEPAAEEKPEAPEAPAAQEESPAEEAPAEEAPAEGLKATQHRRKTVRKRPADLKFSGEKKNASASMADLMKLMEQEQNKLKQQLGQQEKNK